ncbi:hypothetical protein ACLQ2R_17705 [Streptosporangium sp. DT93]|uniref:hypothetical protein n=1 Tax=Streptosporangium sp. DT93 TaxID=3393428 RepID=UPI003CEBB7EC
MHETCGGRPVIRLRHGEWERHMTSKELTTDDARAAHIGVSRTTVLRIQNGGIQPGREFIAAALCALPDIKFEDLFEVTRAAS